MKDGTAIIDKGFFSRSNVDRLDEPGIGFIMSLRRSTAGLDYTVFNTRENSGADGGFLYQKRPIWWKRLEIYGQEVFLYLDEAHRSDESEDHMHRVLDPKNGKYTMEGYRGKSLQFGTLVLMSTGGKDAQGTYLCHKTRNGVKQAIDAFKNIRTIAILRFMQFLLIWILRFMQLSIIFVLANNIIYDIQKKNIRRTAALEADG